MRLSWDANMKDSGVTANILAKKSGISIVPGQTAVKLTNNQVVKLYNYIKDTDPKLQQQLRNTGVTPLDADRIVAYVDGDPKLTEVCCRYSWHISDCV